MLSLFCKWFLNTMYTQAIKDIKDFLSTVQQIMIETFASTYYKSRVSIVVWKVCALISTSTN